MQKASFPARKKGVARIKRWKDAEGDHAHVIRVGKTNIGPEKKVIEVPWTHAISSSRTVEGGRVHVTDTHSGSLKITVRAPHKLLEELGIPQAKTLPSISRNPRQRLTIARLHGDTHVVRQTGELGPDKREDYEFERFIEGKERPLERLTRRKLADAEVLTQYDRPGFRRETYHLPGGPLKTARWYVTDTRKKKKKRHVQVSVYSDEGAKVVEVSEQTAKDLKVNHTFQKNKDGSVSLTIVTVMKSRKTPEKTHLEFPSVKEAREYMQYLIRQGKDAKKK